MTRYGVYPLAPPDQIDFSVELYDGDDSEEAAGAIAQHLHEYDGGLLLLDREDGSCSYWRHPAPL